MAAVIKSLFAPRDQQQNSGNTATVHSASKPATLLVIQGDDYDWPAIFKDCKLKDGRPIQVFQAGWTDLLIHASTFSRPSLCVEVLKQAKTVSAPAGSSIAAQMGRPITITPDFVLVRNEVTGPSFDGRNLLNGLMYVDMPSVNSLQSIMLFCERPAIQGQLLRLQRRLGNEAFPVVPQHFASSHRCFMYGYTFPAVVKVGSAHAGAGKMKITDHHQMSDFRSVLQMMPNEHCMAEPFIKSERDLRIQKIGSHYRAFRRTSVSGDWKTNTGSAEMEELEMTDRWRAWADAAAGIFGGLEILTVDALVEEGTGKEYILEVNGTSSGLHPDCAEEDNGFIKELVMERMNDECCASEDPLNARSGNSVRDPFLA